MKLLIFPTCNSDFSVGSTGTIARTIHRICLERGAVVQLLTWYHSYTVEGDIPDDICNAVRGIHRFIGDGLNGRRTCGFVVVSTSLAGAMGAKTVLRWVEQGDKWMVIAKGAAFTCIGRAALPSDALSSLLVALKRIHLDK